MNVRVRGAWVRGASLAVLLLAACPGAPEGPGDETTAATSSGSSGGSTGGATGEPTGGATSGSTATAATETGGTVTGETSTGPTTGGSTDTGTTAGESGTGESGTGETGTSGLTAGESTGTSGESTGTTETGGESSTGECVLGPLAEMTAMELEAVVDGVLYPSESDYPWIVETFACASPVTEANVKEIIAPVYVPHPGQGTLEERAIEVKTLDWLFDKLTVPKDWWTDYEYMRAEEYEAIKMVLVDNLTDLVVFRIGEKSGDVLSGAIDVYVFGTTAEGDLVAIWTVSVET